MASPIVGNYGVFEDTSESTRHWVEAYILRDLTKVEGDQRKAEDLDEYLTRNNIPGIYGIDTRALTLLIREHVTMLGLLTDGSKEDADIKTALERIQKYDGSQLVPMVSRKNKTVFPAGQKGWDIDKLRIDAASGKPTSLVPAGGKIDNRTADGALQSEKLQLKRIALIDFGVKQNIIWNLVSR